MALLPSVLTKGSSELYPFTSFTFTTGGIQGQNGPTLTILRGAYSATSWTQNSAYLNMTTQGIQRWTVPATANYRISASGGVGGIGRLQQGGAGALMAGTFALTQSNVVQILVGHRGANGTNCGGGGGGSFVVMADGTHLIVAGGGGGGEYSINGTTPFGDNKNATVSTSGRAGINGSAGDVDSAGQGGTNGGGGTTSSSYPGSGAAGGGLNGNGANAFVASGYSNAFGGLSFVNGGTGGRSVENSVGLAGAGGFGGGGGADWLYWTGGGGGGGYSGGGGGVFYGFGGAGGSYNVGSSQSNVGGNNFSDGYVTITKL